MLAVLSCSKMARVKNSAKCVLAQNYSRDINILNAWQHSQLSRTAGVRPLLSQITRI